MYQNSRQIEDIEHQILNTVGLSIGNLVKQFGSYPKLKHNLQDLADQVERISGRERLMRSYANSEGPLERHKLEAFASSSVAQGVNSVRELLTRMKRSVLGSPNLPSRRPGLLELVLEAMGKRDNDNLGLSAQQLLYQLYSTIVITDLRGYSLMQFSWMLLKVYGKDNVPTKAKRMRQTFEYRANRIQMLLQQVMTQASREYWRCDPERNQHKEGKTFVQITRLLQGYVELELNMNTDNTCMEECSFYSWGVQQEGCYKDQYCTMQPKCSGKNLRLYCFCLCDDAGKNSDRYINMRESVSDVMDNKVVTGMRFIKKNQIIHLIVQQGRLLPRGQIDNTTLEWVEPHSYTVISQNVRTGRDYHTLNRINRSLDLDDLNVPQGYVVTGVRFRLLGNHLNLEIRKTQMNFATGQLVDPDKSIWIGNDNTERSNNKRTELKLDRPNVPLLSPLKSIPDSTSNQFIQFRASDRDMDAAQTTVPFFDAQPVAPVRPVPLSGAGLFHKGRPKFGGFVAPKIMTYDFLPHIVDP
ncbi:hypothetical protein quinque_014764 [Culex quinquefasciatus]